VATDLDLLLDLQRRQWFVSADGSEYLINRNAPIAESAGYLPVTLVEEEDDPLVPAGRAEVSCPDGTLLFNLIAANESAGRRVSVDADGVRLHACRWTKGRPARDKWVMADAVLSVENVRRLRLSCYLPKVDGETSKTLQISSAAGYSRRTSLIRGKSTTFELIPPFPGQHRLHFRTTPEQSARDRRVLGFVLVDMEVQTEEHAGVAAS